MQQRHFEPWGHQMSPAIGGNFWVNRRKKILRFAALLLCLSAASGAQAFVISDVRVEGLQRIGAGAVPITAIMMI